MKKFFLTSLLVIGMMYSNSQTYTSDCLCTQNLITVHKNDAYRLAWKRINDLSLTYKDSVTIPLPIVDSILKNLALVNNIPASSLRDTLQEVFANTDFLAYQYAFGEDSTHVHGFIPSLKKMTVVVQQGTPFAADWIAGNYTATADAQINQLMSQYQLTAQLQSTLAGMHTFVVRTAVNRNTTALSKLFHGITGVNIAGTVPFDVPGDGARILYTRTASATLLTYDFRCGDCPLGCTNWRKWEFRIPDNTCDVEYLGTSNSGSGVTPPYNFGCEITIPPGGYGSPAAGNVQCTAGNFIIAALPPLNPGSPRIQNYEFRLHPNPARNTLVVELPRNLDRHKTFRIADLSGKTVLIRSHSEKVPKLALDISQLPNGQYSLTIETPYSFNTLRFLKI